MNAIKRYNIDWIGLGESPDGNWVKFSNIQPYVEQQVAAAVQAERERCRRDEVAPLREAIMTMLAESMCHEECTKPLDYCNNECPECLSYRAALLAIAAVEKIQKERP